MVAPSCGREKSRLYQDMDFKSQYVQALRDHDPVLFRDLVKRGQMDAYLQEKSLEAHRLLADLLAAEPKGPDGFPKDPQAERLAEERVKSQMLDFSLPEKDQNPEPPDDLTRMSRASTSRLSLAK